MTQLEIYDKVILTVLTTLKTIVSANQGGSFCILEGNMRKNEIKPALTISEQVQLLKDRGIEIEDENQAECILDKITYYRLSGYTWCWRNNNHLPQGLTFEQIYGIYCFDKEFKQLLLVILEEIEITFRSRVVNLLAIKYGPIGYRETGNFDILINDKVSKQDVIEKHINLIRKIDAEISRSKEQYIKHYKEKYDGFPIWVAAETMSFGTIAMLYGLLNKEDAAQVARSYGLRAKFLKSWMQHLAYTRNVCAHYGRLYGKIARTKPFLPALMKRKGYEEGTLLATLDIIKSVTKGSEEWEKFRHSLEELIKCYEDRIDLTQLGFCESWKDILN